MGKTKKIRFLNVIVTIILIFAFTSAVPAVNYGEGNRISDKNNVFLGESTPEFVIFGDGQINGILVWLPDEPDENDDMTWDFIYKKFINNTAKNNIPGWFAYNINVEFFYGNEIIRSGKHDFWVEKREDGYYANKTKDTIGNVLWILGPLPPETTTEPETEIAAEEVTTEEPTTTEFAAEITTTEPTVTEPTAETTTAEVTEEPTTTESAAEPTATGYTPITPTYAPITTIAAPVTVPATTISFIIPTTITPAPAAAIPGTTNVIYTEPAVIDISGNLIPLDNGMWANDLGDDLYEILDEEGVPLTEIHLGEDENIEDIEDIEDIKSHEIYESYENPVPLGDVISDAPKENKEKSGNSTNLIDNETAKNNPKTGDGLYPLILLSSSCSIILIIIQKRYTKRV